MLKRSPRPLLRTQFLAFFSQPALRQKFICVRPEGGIVLTGMRDEPDQSAWVGRIMQAIAGIGDCERRLAAACGGCCREEAHGFFDDGCGVGELV